MINSFIKEHFFLNIIYDMKITYNGLTYKNPFSAYLSMKTLDEDIRYKFCKMSYSDAKRYIEHYVEVREDWNDVKDSIMEEINRIKFTSSKVLQNKLINTGTQELINGNTLNDKYWGVYKGKGFNKLGIILMKIRDELN